MKPALFFLAFIMSATAFAQFEEGDYKEASKESQAYHKYRQHLSYPVYSAEKVNNLVRKQVMVDSEDNRVLKEKAYNGLSFREKFTYNMIHGEWFNQNCAAMPPIQDEQTKIFGYLPDVFNEFTWSERQLAFFKDNKDSVLALIKESTTKSHRIGVNYKQIIVEMNAREIIPYLIKTYTPTRKDHDILTVLMLLMKEAKYEPFINSASYKKLYGDESSYQAFLSFNKANEDLIINRATEFYNGSTN